LRPGDIIRSRHGKTIEITNTDAEGRLILSDAIAAAVEEGAGIYPNKKAALIVDFATLTGAARVALADIPALFSNDITKAMNLWKISTDCHDLLWPMPLHEPFRDNLKSNVADIGKKLVITQHFTTLAHSYTHIVNAAESPGGGAITAALYLSEFLEDKKKDSGDSSNSSPLWFHIDFMGTKNNNAEPMGLRSLYEYIVKEIVK